MKIPLTTTRGASCSARCPPLLTALGIALVVAVFIGMLALANGFPAALITTGSEQNVLVLRQGADSELSSGLDRRRDRASSAPRPTSRAGPTAGRCSAPRCTSSSRSASMGDTTELANVVVRGVSAQAWKVRNNVTLEAGRRPAAGKTEICVGKKMAGRFHHTGIGETLHFAGRHWTVVCHFARRRLGVRVGDLGRERAVHAGVPAATPSSRSRSGCKDPASFDEAKRTLEADKRLTVDVHRESDFYAEQSELLGRILPILALMITSIMAVGAVFGAINTMYAAVASRAPRDRRAADARVSGRGACWPASWRSRR